MWYPNGFHIFRSSVHFRLSLSSAALAALISASSARSTRRLLSACKLISSQTHTLAGFWARNWTCVRWLLSDGSLDAFADSLDGSPNGSDGSLGGSLDAFRYVY